MSVHDAATRGFGRAAAAYERGRPGYPPAAVEWLLEHLRIGPGSTVVDLGAGTGKLTRMLVPTGARLIAIEPVAGMRDELRRAVGGIEIVNGTAEAIPCPDGSADAVTAAQAFHWFATAAALREIHRVLGDGGGLGLIWNRRDLRDPLQAGLETIIQRYRSDSPAHERNDWRTAFDGNALFALEAQRQFPHRQDADPETVVDRVLSTSFIASLDEAAQASVTGDVMALIANQPALILHYLTDVFVFRRR